MAPEGNQIQKENNNSFGLPKATFKPIEPNKSNTWLRITAIIAVIVILIGAGVIYWLFKRSSSDSFMANALKNRQKEEIQHSLDKELQDLDEVSDEFTEELATPSADFEEHLKQEATHQQAQAPLQDHHRAKADAAHGAIREVTAPQGCYYVVISSYIDKDLAMDYAKKLVKQGEQLTIIAPAQGKYFFRLAVDQKPTLQEASQRAAALKDTYGSNIWVLKY